MRTLNHLSMAVCGLLATLVSSPAPAGALDRTKMLYCSAAEAFECAEGSSCDRTLPTDIGAPRFFQIDLANHVAQGAGPGARGAKSPIRALDEVGGLIVLHGFDKGSGEERGATGWTAAISPDDGGFVLTAAGEGTAFVIFGGCLNPE